MFKLDFELPPSELKINLQDNIYLSGSCFSDEIGNKLTAHKFNNLHNPFGTLYNPISIFKSIGESLDINNIIENQGVYYHWDCHGKISGLSKGEVEKQVQIIQMSSVNFLKNSSVLILTLGTAFVYRYHHTEEIVGNCHKVPASNFTKQTLNKEEIVRSFSELYKNLKSDLAVIFTVSPVRHLRDGLIQNNLSKAILIEAVHEMVKAYENVHYFPAYEIMNDELRDYRFFAEDMAHPSPQAVDYIWDKFANAYFDEETQTFIRKWNKISQALNHKPFQPTSEKHQNFLKRTLSELEELKDQVDVASELKLLRDKII